MVRSEAEEARRGFGVQGKGAASPFPLLPRCRRDSFLVFHGWWIAFLAHGLSAHLDAMGIVNQTVEDAIGDRGIADLLVPSLGLLAVGLGLPTGASIFQLLRNRQAAGPGWCATTAASCRSSSSANQDNPMSHDFYPIMGNDVWEHAYYPKYQNRRADYLKEWWNVVNWAEINKRFQASGK